MLLIVLGFLLISQDKSQCSSKTMGYDVARFMGDVDEELLCPICSGVLEDPLQAPECEHAFCMGCIQGEKSLGYSSYAFRSVTPFSSMVFI